MPCVFPVLAIKMLGFVKTQERRVRVQSGVAYTAGALLSFVALGGLLLALRAAGEQLGWGFQLQNPGVVAGLAAFDDLRAAAGPAFGCRMMRIVGPAAAVSAGGTTGWGLPSSTTTISNVSAGSVCRASAARHSRSRSGRA
jgi:hypothetical protein